MTEDIRKQIEEKAREYTDSVIGNYHYAGWDKSEAIIELNNAYISGCHSRDEEVKELREALKEIVRLFNSDCSGLSSRQWEDLQDKRQEALVKAKQLLKA